MRTLETPDGPMDAIVEEPTGAPRGGVVVVQEAFGLTPHIGSVTARLAADGWLAVAPALFHRTGSPQLEYGDLESIGPHFGALTSEGVMADLRTALGVFDEAGIPARGRGIVGFCMGGTVALVAGAELDLGAAVTFYGGGVTTGRFGFPPLVEVAPRLRTPWQGHFGDQDQGIPVEQVEALREAAATAPVETEVWRYAEAGHGFNCDDRDAYHEASAASAWARTLDWFGTHLEA
jgi:carboxymethylenebutenolidase